MHLNYDWKNSLHHLKELLPIIIDFDITGFWSCLLLHKLYYFTRSRDLATLGTYLWIHVNVNNGWKLGTAIIINYEPTT